MPEPADLTEEALLDFRDGLEAAGRARVPRFAEHSGIAQLFVRLVRLQGPRAAISALRVRIADRYYG